MRIELTGIGKRFRWEWILKNVNLDLQPGQAYAVTGPNGAGKSTLLKLISGHLTPSKGKIRFSLDQSPIEINKVFRQVAYAAPYIELIEEFTLPESILFHHKFQPLRDGLDASGLMDLLGFPASARKKQVRHFSSGMKQRLKLALSICSRTSVLLLDEPSTNLDTQGVEWFHGLIRDFTGPERLVVVASNVEVDLAFCGPRINILDLKS
ncbi:MAG: ABC transporter ATP-binding protein [Lewinellaceae bacterium]|nr:ABC transporter ATP-binding protein [Lewinella sp.]MCB9278880.1 ABC transporter ATP-binding protein [Lewinellaceae bacterium]